MISEDDLALYKVFDDPDEAAKHVLGFYRNYHSQRFVNDTLVIRMLRPLTDAQVASLNDEFAFLIKEGKIEQAGSMDKEERYRELPRLRFTFAKRAYGKLRKMIDRINEMDKLNAG